MEGVLGVFDVASFCHRTGDMWPADCAIGYLKHTFPADVYSKLAQFLYGALSSFDASFAKVGEIVLQAGRAEVHKMADQVDFRFAFFGAQLYSGDQRQVRMACLRRLRFGYSFGGVVVRNGHDPERGLCDLIDQLGRRKLSVRRGCVEVEIDQRRNGAAGVILRSVPGVILDRRTQRVIRINSF